MADKEPVGFGLGRRGLYADRIREFGELRDRRVGNNALPEISFLSIFDFAYYSIDLILNKIF